MAAHNITPTVHNTRVHINTATPPIQHSLASFSMLLDTDKTNLSIEIGSPRAQRTAVANPD